MQTQMIAVSQTALPAMAGNAAESLPNDLQYAGQFAKVLQHVSACSQQAGGQTPDLPNAANNAASSEQSRDSSKNSADPQGNGIALAVPVLQGNPLLNQLVFPGGLSKDELLSGAFSASEIAAVSSGQRLGLQSIATAINGPIKSPGWGRLIAGQTGIEPVKSAEGNGIDASAGGLKAETILIPDISPGGETSSAQAQNGAAPEEAVSSYAAAGKTVNGDSFITKFLSESGIVAEAPNLASGPNVAANMAAIVSQTAAAQNIFALSARTNQNGVQVLSLSSGGDGFALLQTLAAAPQAVLRAENIQQQQSAAAMIAGKEKWEQAAPIKTMPASDAAGVSQGLDSAGKFAAAAGLTDITKETANKNLANSQGNETVDGSQLPGVAQDAFLNLKNEETAGPANHAPQIVQPGLNLVNSRKEKPEDWDDIDAIDQSRRLASFAGEGEKALLQAAKNEAPAEQAQLNRQAVLTQTIEQVKMALRSQRSEMTVSLNPEHLGELTLKISVANGTVNAAFHASNREVQNIIETSLPQLRQGLANHGLKVDNVSVYASLEQFNPQERRGQWQAQPRSPIRRITAEEALVPVSAKAIYQGMHTAYGIDLLA